MLLFKTLMILDKSLVFDIRYQKNFSSAEPTKVRFKVDGKVPAGVGAYALILTNQPIPISSVCHRHFDLM